MLICAVMDERNQTEQCTDAILNFTSQPFLMIASAPLRQRYTRIRTAPTELIDRTTSNRRQQKAATAMSDATAEAVAAAPAEIEPRSEMAESSAAAADEQEQEETATAPAAAPAPASAGDETTSVAPVQEKKGAHEEATAPAKGKFYRCMCRRYLRIIAAHKMMHARTARPYGLG